MPTVKIVSKENGPNVVMVDGDVRFALCRCGGSQNKPFCDGTHAKIGFKAEGKELIVLE